MSNFSNLMNGYDAEIYEMHSLPRRLCTSWKRKDYTIDGCFHWLTGSVPSDSFYKLWKELGAIQERKIYDSEAFYQYTGLDIRTLILYSDVDRLEKHMKEFSPSDSENIELLCRLIRKISKFKPPQDKAFELFNFIDIIKLIFKMRPFMKDLNYCNSITMKEFAGRFKDPLLREVLPLPLADKDVSLLSFVVTMALLNNRPGGFPEGRSLKFARAIENRLSISR